MFACLVSVYERLCLFLHWVAVGCCCKMIELLVCQAQEHRLPVGSIRGKQEAK